MVPHPLPQHDMILRYPLQLPPSLSFLTLTVIGTTRADKGRTAHAAVGVAKGLAAAVRANIAGLLASSMVRRQPLLRPTGLENKKAYQYGTMYHIVSLT